MQSHWKAGATDFGELDENTYSSSKLGLTTFCSANKYGTIPFGRTIPHWGGAPTHWSGELTTSPPWGSDYQERLLGPAGFAERLGSPYSKTYPLPSLASDREQTIHTSVHSRERPSTPEWIMHTSLGSYLSTEPMFAFQPRELDCRS